MDQRDPTSDNWPLICKARQQVMGDGGAPLKRLIIHTEKIIYYRQRFIGIISVVLI